MKGIIMRIKMRICLHSLEKLWYENNDFISGQAALKFSSTPSKLKTLKALQSAGCAILYCADNSNRPYAIGEGENSALYIVERSEIWMNRIVGYIAGILTSVAAHYIIQFLQSVSFH